MLTAQERANELENQLFERRRRILLEQKSRLVALHLRHHDIEKYGIDFLSLGQMKAKTLGVAVLPLQVGIYFCASLVTVAALMLAGAIRFVGLIVPHAVRLLAVNDYRWLLPLSILLGGCFLTLADTLARTLWAPQQLPVGVLTALLGVPMLLLLLSKKR